jgi:hypothetical protein
MRGRIAAAALLCAGLAACASQPRQTALIPPSAPSGEPPGIAGLASMQVKAAFGEPSFVRKDGVSEMWRYDGQTCRAFFFLYPSDNGKVVRHVETLPRGNEMAADTTCLDALRSRAKVS